MNTAQDANPQYRALTAAAAFYRAQLPESWVPQYLTDRGLHPALRYRWLTGYAPAGWTALVDHLRAEGHSSETILSAGLAFQGKRGNLLDRFRDRVMFPVRDLDGQVRGFTGRVNEGYDDERTPRWLNSPQSEVYAKKELLHGLYEAMPALKVGAVLAVAEGATDVISVTEAGRGLVVGVGPCGTALTAEQVDIIKSVARSGVVVAFDPDAAGRKASTSSWSLLNAGGITADSADLPDRADPADVYARYGPNVLVEALTRRTRPLVEAVLHSAIEPSVHGYEEHDAYTREIAAIDAIPILAALPREQMVEYAVKVAADLQLPVRVVTDSLIPNIVRALPKDPGSVRGPVRLSDLLLPDGDIDGAGSDPSARAGGAEAGWFETACPSSPDGPALAAATIAPPLAAASPRPTVALPPTSR